MVLENFATIAQSLIGQFGYLAVFTMGVISTAGIVFFIPPFITITAAMAFGLHPLLVGIFIGFGLATGQLTGYLLGLGGGAVLQKYEKKTPKVIKNLERLFKKFGFWFIMIYAALPVKPVSFDVVGILSGVSRYDIRKFYLALVIAYVVTSVLTAYGLNLAIPYIKGLFSLVF